MIEFNELVIRGNKLIIDVSIKSDNPNESLTNIIIDTQKTYISNGPSDFPVYNKTIETEYKELYALPDTCNNVKVDSDKEDCYVEYGVIKNIHLELSAADLKDNNLDTNIFFVYVNTTEGVSNNIGIVYNKNRVFNMGMSYIRELCNSCEVPKGFIDYILRLKAFEISLNTGNYQQAFKYWDKFFNKEVTNCNCDGNK